MRPIQASLSRQESTPTAARRGSHTGTSARRGRTCARTPGRASAGRPTWPLALALTLALAASAASGSPAVDAIQGPWRWLAPGLGHLKTAGPETVGPWREVAITRDAVRRSSEIDRLEAELVARDGGLVGAWDAPGTARAPILRKAALDSARLLEAAGEPVAAARAYGSVIDSGEVVLVDVWHGLAVNLARSGDALAAERAFLRGLDASGRASDQIRFRYDLAGFYAREGRLVEALAVVEALAPHAR